MDAVVGQGEAADDRRDPAGPSSATIGIEPPLRTNAGATPHGALERLRRPARSPACRASNSAGCARVAESISTSAPGRQRRRAAGRSSTARHRVGVLPGRQAHARPSRAPTAGTTVRGSPATISLTSSDASAPVALVVLGARAGVDGARRRRSASASSPGGRRAQDARSASATAARCPRAAPRARARRAPGSDRREQRVQHVQRVQRAAAVHAGVQVALGRRGRRRSASRCRAGRR